LTGHRRFQNNVPPNEDSGSKEIKGQQSFLQVTVDLENPNKYTVGDKMCTVLLLFIVTAGDRIWVWPQPELFFM